LLILRARYKTVVLVALASLALALAVIAQLPVNYKASASLLVDVRSTDPLAAVLSAGNRATQEDIIKSDRVAAKVVRRLRLAEDPALQEEWRAANNSDGTLELWLGRRLQRGLTIAPPRRDSTILTIEFTATDPAFAAAAANAFAQAYVETTVELGVEPSKQFARWFAEQSRAMRENLEKAQARVSQYQQQKGIVVTNERMDLESTKLMDLNTQLSAVQAQMAEARSKLRSSAEVLPEVAQSTVVQGLRTDVARQEARLKVAAGNLGRNHPEYRRMEAELEELKARLRSETQVITSGVSASRAINSDREKELKAAIDAQTRRLLELRSELDRMAILQRDVDAAKSAYDGIARRYMQTNLESQAPLTNVSVLTPAEVPLEPGRRTERYLQLALLASLALGLAAALWLEMVDRRIRCADDLAEMLKMPVIAVVKRGKRPSLARPSAPLALR
jgi:chain length determinant protein EpsF